MIKNYFNEIHTRESQMQLEFAETNEHRAIIEMKEKEFLEVSDELENVKIDLTAIKNNLTKLKAKLNQLEEKVLLRNRNLAIAIHSIANKEFEDKYKEGTKKKELIKMYGKRTCDKMMKQEIDELIGFHAQEHNEKRKTLTELISSVESIEETIKNKRSYHEEIKKLEVLYTAKAKELREFIQCRKKEKEVVKESYEELDKRIEETVNFQMNELKKEKKTLFKKYNILFFVDKIKDIEQQKTELQKQLKELEVLKNKELHELQENTQKLLRDVFF